MPICSELFHMDCPWFRSSWIRWPIYGNLNHSWNNWEVITSAFVSSFKNQGPVGEACPRNPRLHYKTRLTVCSRVTNISDICYRIFFVVAEFSYLHCKSGIRHQYADRDTWCITNLVYSVLIDDSLF